MKFYLLALIYLYLPIQLLAQGNDSNGDATLSVDKIAHVVIDGKNVLRVHGVNAYTAEQRAQAIQQRIIAIAKDTSVTVDDIRLVEDSIRMKVLAGDELILNIYKSDALYEKMDRRVLAEFVKDKVGNAISDYRSDRSRPVLVKKVTWVVVSTLLWGIAFFVLLWILRKLQSVLMLRLKNRVDVVADKSNQVVRANQFWHIYSMVFKTFKVVFVVTMAAFYVNSVLAMLPWTAGFGAYIFDLFLGPLKTLGTGVLNYLPSLAFCVVLFLATRYLLKLLKLLFNGVAQGDIVINGFDAEWALPTFRIVRLLVVVFAIIVAYPYIPGSETSAFKGVTVFVGVLFSLGSSSFIGNLIAGYTLTYRKAFKVGDRIKVNEYEGFVEGQKVFVTKLRSLKNEEIIISNSMLLNSNIINYSTKARESGVVVHTIVGIGYETPWRQVDAMLLEAAARTILVQKQPAPFVLKKSLGDFAVNYEINGYCTNAAKLNDCYNELHQNILDVFNENNVQIMTPNYEGDPEIPKVVADGQWDVPLAKRQS